MSECIMLIALSKIRLEKDAISAGPKSIFCSTPPPLIHRRFKNCQRTKINKAMFSASPSSVFATNFAISVLKSKYVFHPNGKWTRTASLIVLNWVSKFYSSTDFEHKFHKTGIENWIPVRFNLALITTTVRSTTNEESLKLLYIHLNPFIYPSMIYIAI